MTARTTLQDARRLCLEYFVTHELEDNVDYRTGEILVRREYTAQGYRPGTDRTPVPFHTIRSEAGLSRFMDDIDRRTLVTVNDCRRLYDADKGSVFLHGRAVRFTSSQYRVLAKLVDRLDYANSRIGSPQAIARDLGVRPDHLRRQLGRLGPLVRVYDTGWGMAYGTLRVDVSPAYGFRYPKAGLEAARADAITTWYRALLQ